MSNESKTLYLHEDTRYGALRYKPANSLAERFCELVQQKSLTAQNVAAIKALGYECKLAKWLTKSEDL